MTKKWKHSNRYIYHFDRIFSKEEILEYFGDGWADLIETAHNMIDMIPTAKICSARRCTGMLHVYIRADDEFHQNCAEGIAWKIERMSAKICETCGEYGKRRKELKKVMCLCQDCYITYLNSIENPISLFREGQTGRFITDEE